jgi:hypothetical protein
MARPTNRVIEIERKIQEQLTVARDKPRIWHIGSIVGDEAQSYAEEWIARPNNLEHDAVADEESRQITTSPTYKKGRTHSLHDLKTDDRQQFHIHLPSTPAGTKVDARKLKEAASHRFLTVVTGKTPGLFEWADAKGELKVEDNNGISVATGAVADKGYRVEIPPYSIYAIELMGGIHHFHNIRGFSFHRENMPTQGQGDDLTLNTQQWRGDKPKEFASLQPSHIYPNVDADLDSVNHPQCSGRPQQFQNKLGLEVFLKRTQKTLEGATGNMKLGLEGDEERSPYRLMMDVYVQAKHCAQPPRTMDQLVAQTFGAQRTGLRS